MNIFLVDKSPEICAQALDDLRLNKMILETAQMLCVGYRRHFPNLAEKNKDLLYKETHANHPCNVWLKDELYNYVWLVDYLYQLNHERYYRIGKCHLSFSKLYTLLFTPIVSLNVHTDLAYNFDCSNVVDIPLCKASIFDRYKYCLKMKWASDKKKPTWTRRGPPNWQKAMIISSIAA